MRENTALDDAGNYQLIFSKDVPRNILFFFVFLGHVQNFPLAVFFCTLALFSKTFHHFGIVVNVLDLAPKHSGSVKGIVNSFASISGYD